MGINQNKLAREVSLMEEGKKEVSIAQIKEIIKCTLQCLAEEDIVDVIKLVRKHEIG
jgi:hypothetical protein